MILTLVPNIEFKLTSWHFISKLTAKACSFCTAQSQFLNNPDKLEDCQGTTRRAYMNLTFDLSKWNLQMAYLLKMENNCVKTFWNPSTTVEVMVPTNSDERTHRHTPSCSCNNHYVSLTASGLDKKPWENWIVKGEMLETSVFSFFLQCFLPFSNLNFSIWTCLKFCHMVKSSVVKGNLKSRLAKQ